MKTRCAHCGTTQRPVTTAVIDWKTDLLCDLCVASFDWSGWGWRFDPIVNTYTSEH